MIFNDVFSCVLVVWGCFFHVFVCLLGGVWLFSSCFFLFVLVCDVLDGVFFKRCLVLCCSGVLFGSFGA